MQHDTAWTHEDIHDLTGKKIIVTGANSGIRFEAAMIGVVTAGVTVEMLRRSPLAVRAMTGSCAMARPAMPSVSKSSGGGRWFGSGT